MRTRKLIMFALSVCASIILLSTVASAATSGYCGGEGDGKNLSWSLNTSTGEFLIQGSGKMADYKFGVGFPTSPPWYDNRKSIKKVVIQDGVTNLGSSSFMYCENLESIEIPESVTEIHDHALIRCEGLKQIDLPDTLTKIGASALAECESLSQISIPSGVTEIGDYAFSNNPSLTKITIPRNVVKFGDLVFWYCSSLSEISVDELNQYYSSKDGVLFDKKAETLIWFPAGKGLTNYTVPETVKTIARYAFRANSSLETVTITGSVDQVSERAFEYCKNLTEVFIEDGLETLDDYAFYGCVALNDIEIPNTVNKLGHDAFWCCYDLRTIKIPGSVSSIGENAFHCCTSLKNVMIENGVETVGNYVFSGCKTLTEIVFPETITEVGSNVFSECAQLKNVIFCGDAPQKIGENSFPEDILIYYHLGKNGWTTPTWNGYQTAVYETEKTVDVALNPNGGTCDNEKISVTVGQVYGVLPTPTYPGHVFQGWYTQPEGGDQVAEDTIVTATDAHTLYAHWTEVPENTAVVSIENMTLKPGETAEVVASIQNNPGIAGYHFEVAADTSVFSVSKEDGELLVERGDFSKKGSVFANVSENGWGVLWYHTNNVTTDGALFRMTVKVSDDAAPGVYPITIQGVPADIVDEKGNIIPVTCVSGAITIANVVPGDVNGDGERTNADVIYLARSLLGLVTLDDSQKSAADLNGDGIVSNAEVIRLARILIGLDQI